MHIEILNHIRTGHLNFWVIHKSISVLLSRFATKYYLLARLSLVPISRALPVKHHVQTSSFIHHRWNPLMV